MGEITVFKGEKAVIVTVIAVIVLAGSIALGIIAMRHALDFYPRLAGRLGRPVPVETISVRNGGITLTIWGTGEIEPKMTVQFGAPLDGWIKSVPVFPGDRVHPGQVLVLFDNYYLDDAVESARHGLERARMDLENFRSRLPVQREIYNLSLRSAKERWLAAKGKYSESLRHYRDDKMLLEKGYISLDELKKAEIALKDAEADRRIAESEYLKAQNELALFDKESEKQLHQLQQAVQDALIALKQAQKQLDSCTVRSNMEGWVLSVAVDPGEYIQTGKPLLSVASYEPIMARVSVPQELSGYVAKGMKGTVVVHSWPLKSLYGEVFAVGAAIDVKTGGEPVWIRLSDGAEVRPGIKVRAFMKRRLEGPIVPKMALMGPAEGRYVFVVKGGKAHIRRVWVAGEDEFNALIEKGLEPGEKVVVAGQLYLRDGTVVREEAARRDIPSFLIGEDYNATR